MRAIDVTTFDDGGRARGGPRAMAQIRTVCQVLLKCWPAIRPRLCCSAAAAPCVLPGQRCLRRACLAGKPCKLLAGERCSRVQRVEEKSWWRTRRCPSPRRESLSAAGAWLLLTSAQVSFGTIGLGVGLTLLSAGFLGYFGFVGGRGAGAPPPLWSPVLRPPADLLFLKTTRFPRCCSSMASLSASLVSPAQPVGLQALTARDPPGFALKYAELKPLVCERYGCEKSRLPWMPHASAQLRGCCCAARHASHAHHAAGAERRHSLPLRR